MRLRQVEIYCLKCDQQFYLGAINCHCRSSNYIVCAGGKRSMLRDVFGSQRPQLIVYKHPDNDTLFWHLATGDNGQFIQSAMPRNMFPIPVEVYQFDVAERIGLLKA